MFKWLTNLVTGKKKKDTEIRNLKDHIQKEIREAKAAADRGDSNASLRIKALEETITEQSIRLTGHKKPPSTVILPPDAAKAFLGALLMAAALGGCGPSYNTVEEADREGIDVQRQIHVAQDVELDRIEEALAKEPDLKTAAIMPIVERMREKNADAKAIASQLLANFHGPKQPKVYAHAEVESLLKRMHDAHTATFWAGVGAALLAGATGIISLARSPLAKMIPGIGTILTSLDGTMAAVETWMQKMKDSGKPELAEGLAGVLQAAHQDPRIGAYIDKKLGKIQVGSLAPHPEVQLATSLAADAAVKAISSS